MQEIYTETIRAFNLAEQFRSPVVVLYDQVIAHSSSRCASRAGAIVARNANGRAATSAIPSLRRDRRPHPADGASGRRLARPRTGLTHTADGFPTQNPELAARAVQRLLDKIERHRARIESFEALQTEDADVVIVAVGIVARAARRAVRTARRRDQGRAVPPDHAVAVSRTRMRAAAATRAPRPGRRR